MNAEQSEESLQAQIDPFKQWVQFWDSWTKAWSEPMSEAVASRGFAESMGQQLEGSLETVALMRQQMGGLMQQVLQQMSLPTRSDVVGLAERLTNLEMRLDDIDATTGEILKLLKAIDDRLDQDELSDERSGGN
jgi:hypothetical protein